MEKKTYNSGIFNDIFKNLQKKSFVSLKHVLLFEPCELEDILGKDAKKVEYIIREIQSRLSEKIHEPVKVLNLSKQLIDKFTTGIDDLDKVLGGGLRFGKIYTILGPRDSTKEIFCHQLSVTLQLKILEDKKEVSYSTLYIDVNGNFSINEVKRITKRFNLPVDKVLENIYISKPVNYFQIKELIKFKVPRLIESSKLRLLIFDSIDSLMYLDDKEVSYSRIVRKIEYITSWLRKLVRMYNICAVVIYNIDEIASVMDSVYITPHQRVLRSTSLYSTDKLLIRKYHIDRAVIEYIPFEVVSKVFRIYVRISEEGLFEETAAPAPRFPRASRTPVLPTAVGGLTSAI